MKCYTLGKGRGCSFILKKALFKYGILLGTLVSFFDFSLALEG